MITIGITLIGVMLIVAAMAAIVAFAVTMLASVLRDLRTRYGGK